MRFFHLPRLFALGLAAVLVTPSLFALGQPKPAPTKPTASAPAASASSSSVTDKAARGIVVVERAGAAIAEGTVLAYDGRILAPLSAVGAGNDLDVRYADGTTAKVKVGHHDRVWDLALLVPQTGKWSEGLQTSTKDPYTATGVRYFTAASKRPASATITVRGKRTITGGDDKPLEDAVELGARVLATDLGSALVDDEGKVLAILAKGCLRPEPSKPCAPTAFGVPVKAIKAFLKSVPASATLPTATLGAQGESDESGVAKGVRLTSVTADGPAAAAKLAVGDRVLAIGGAPVLTQASLDEAVRKEPAGTKVELLVLKDGKYVTVPVTLGAAPAAASKPKEAFGQRD